MKKKTFEISCSSNIIKEKIVYEALMDYFNKFYVGEKPYNLAVIEKKEGKWLEQGT